MSILRYPPSIDWEVTPYCNHSCIHCYNSWRTNEDKLKDALFNKDVTESYYVDIAQRIVASKPVFVNITGGEPLSVFDSLRPAIELLIKNGILVSMNTNATLLTEDMARFLAANDISLFISFPCANEEICNRIVGIPNAFDRIVAGIRLARRFDVQVGLNMVVSKLNYPFIELTASYVKRNLNIDTFCATKVSLPIHARPVLRSLLLTKEEFHNMLETLLMVRDKYGISIDSAWAYSLCGFNTSEIISQFAFKRRCGAGRFSFCVTYDGGVKACAVDDTIYGNLREELFSTIISRMSSWQKDLNVPKECKDCKSFGLCGGGCRLDAKNTYNDIQALDSSANIDNKEYAYALPVCAKRELKEQFQLNPKTIFTEDNDCVRASCGRKYVFMIYEFYKYLIKHRSFNIEQIMKEFDLSYEIVNAFVGTLLENEILCYN